MTGYKILQQTDMPGLHDYRCRLSLSVATCTVSVYDTREAEDICAMMEECRGFVMSKQTTWTGISKQLCCKNVQCQRKQHGVAVRASDLCSCSGVGSNPIRTTCCYLEPDSSTVV